MSAATDTKDTKQPGNALLCLKCKKSVAKFRCAYKLCENKALLFCKYCGPNRGGRTRDWHELHCNDPQTPARQAERSVKAAAKEAKWKEYCREWVAREERSAAERKRVADESKRVADETTRELEADFDRRWRAGLTHADPPKSTPQAPDAP